MNLAAQVFKSTAYQTVGKIAAVILGMGQYLLMVHFYGATGSGVYAAVTAFLGIAVVLSELGLHITTVTNISKPGSDESKILSNTFTMRVISVITVFTVAAILGFLFLPSGYETRLGILLATTAFAFLSVNQIFVGVFQKYFANHMLVFGEIIAKLITVTAIILLANNGYGILHILASLNIAFGVHLAMTIYFAYKRIPFKFRLDRALCVDLLKQSWPLAFSGILNLVYFKTDTVILESMKGPEAAGVYGLPYKILEVLLAFPALFAGLLLPILSAAAINSIDSFRRIIQHSFNALIYLAILVVVEVMLFAESIIRVATFDRFAEFQDSVPLLQLLIIAIAFLFIGSLFGHAVPALGLQKKMIWGYATAALVGLAAYLILIPRFSYYGAAIGTILTEIFVMFFAARLVLKKSEHHLSYAGALKASLAGIVAALVGLAILNYTPAVESWSQALAATLGGGGIVAVVYIVILFKLGGITRDEIKLMSFRGR